MAEVGIFDSASHAATVAAELVADVIREVRAPVLGVATGSTPERLYAELASSSRLSASDAARIRLFSLDEYVGLAPGHPQSYADYVRREIVEPLGIDPASVRTPDGGAVDPIKEAAAYDARIRDAGGVDLQILGVGHNGHIAFNEPGSSLASRTRVKRLTHSTIEANARFFANEQVPSHCITQGIGTILEARRLLVLAFGRGKAHAVAQALEGPLSARTPASAIQLHPSAIVLLDEAAASDLEFADEYRSAWDARTAFDLV